MATPVSREKGEGIMHINTVMVDGLYIKYNLEIVNNEITIVADFVKDGEIVQKIYNIRTMALQGANMVAALLDNEFAAEHAKKIMS